jgi:hypothetical protein
VRILAGVLAGALALSVTPILGFSAASALEPATGDGSVCEDVTPATEPFTDVASNDSAINEIICLVATGITTGTGTGTTYSPTAPVTRRQMALFLVRMADEIAENAVAGQVTPLPAADGVTPFTDIADEAAEIRAAIDRLEAAEIAQGVTATNFVPGGFVTRRQMAKFIVRLQEFMAGEDITPDNAPDAFTDDNGDSGEAELNTLAAEGVFLGNGAPNTGTVSPGANISRRQMAFVIIRKLQYLFEEGVITRLFAEDDGNQDFTANQQQVTRQLAGTPGSGTGGIIEYRFSGLDAARDYDVALLQCGEDDENADVVLDGGFASFADQNLDDQADGLGDTLAGDAYIATVGFTNIGSSYADDVSPEADGTLLVRVDSQDADCAYVVVFDDNADDDILNLNPATTNSYNTATDAVGVAGPAVWHFGEAPTGTDMDGDYVVFVDKEANFFVLEDGFRYNYDAADSGHYCGAEVDYPLTLAQFESYLSIGDYIYNDCDISTGNYSQTNPNVFQIDDDTVAAPAGVTLSVVNADAGLAPNDIVATITPATPLDGDVDQYCVDLYTNPGLVYTTTVCGDEVNTAGTGDADTTLTFLNVVDGSYVAFAYADSETDDGSYYSPMSNAVSSGAPADVTAPTITDARVATDAGLQNQFDAGDVIALTFSEDMQDALDTTGSFVLTDADGDTFLVDCGNAANATCVLSDDPLVPANVDRVLTVTLVSVTDTNAAGNGVQNMPATITTVDADVEDQAGNVVNLAGSADVIVDKEA